MITRIFEQQHVETAKAFIQKHYNQRITVQEIADHVGVGPKTLQRMFKRQLQTSIQEYQVQVKMEKAIEHLESGVANIKQVSLLLGYKRQSSFTKRFNKHFGKCPSAYVQNGNS